MTLFRFIFRLVLFVLTVVAALVLLVAGLAIVVRPDRLFLPSLLALGYGWLALVNICLAVLWLFTRRKRYAALPVLVLALSFVPLSRLCSVRRAVPPSDAQNTLTVLTYNTLVLGSVYDRQPELLRYLRSCEADVLCLQEIEVHKTGGTLTLDQLKSALGYPYSYIDFKVYKGNRKYGLAVFSRYPLLNKQTLRYESSSNISDRCDLVVGTDTFRIFNNHLQSYRLSPSDLVLEGTDTDHYRRLAGRISNKMRNAYAYRPDQAEVLRREIEASPYPVIVCGDFNDVPVSYVYSTVARGLKDAFLESSPFSLGHTFSHKGVGLRIDYILHSPSLTALSGTVEPLPYSDHRPFRTTLVW